MLITERSKNRKSILIAAERLFSRQGYRATTLRQISAKSGANGALVSYYFGNKDGLREAVIERKLESLSGIFSALDSGISTNDLGQVIRKIFEHIRKDEGFHRLAQRALVEDPDLVKSISTKLWQPLFDQLNLFILRATKNKVSAEEADARCLVLCGMFHQYANLCWLHKGELKTRASFEKTLQNFEDYVVESIVKELCRA